MPEPKKKPKSEKLIRKPRNTTNNNVMNGIPRAEKKKVTKKYLIDDGIAKSKQLAQKLQTTRSSSYGRPKIRSSNNDEVRLCGNGKPMPSLSELEKMYGDSDDNDDEENKVTTPTTTKTPSTPKKQPKLEEKLMSPTTISDIANRMLHLVSTISDPTELLEDGPPPPIIKPKKRKKPDKPYIVGCKDRPKVPEKPCVKFCKGDDKFGPEHNSEDEDDDLPKKRAKRGKKVNLSKSIFNAKSDEIAARLKECNDSDGSSDSNKTVAYEYYTPINSNGPRTFSPLPSTSKDNETFVKNDQRFNESLNSENTLSKSYIDDDVEELETPCETIEIIDTVTSRDTSKFDGSIIEIADDIPIPDVKPESPIVVEDYYSNLDIENIPCDDDCEVINVDDLIAENKAILEKYSKTSNLDTVTLVDTSDLNTTRQRNQVDETNDSNVVSEETAKLTNSVENIIDRSSNCLVTNEQPSVIIMNGEDLSSHRPILVENGNEDIHVDVEVLDDSNYHPIVSDNRLQNHIPMQTFDLNSPIQLNNHTLAPNHRGNGIPGSSGQEQLHHCPHENLIVNNPLPSNPPPRYCHHTGSVLRMRGCCDVNRESQVPQQSADDEEEYDITPNINSYQQQLKILAQFFKKRHRNGQNSRKAKKKNPRLNENILPQGFMSLLQSMTNPSANRLQPSNNTQSPALATSSDSPDKTKRIGDCPICMDSLSNKPIVSTICGHVFCMDCIKLSIRSNGSKCPTCRKPLKKGTGYHQIFL